MKNKKTLKKVKCLLVTLIVFIPVSEAGDSYSPYTDQSYPTKVYFGDTHLHTNLSVDANSFGNKSLTPDEAYRFARGERISVHNGMPVRLRRPLDFLVVADHANNMGLMPVLERGNPTLLATDFGKKWIQTLKATNGEPLKLNELLFSPNFGMFSDDGTVRDTAFRQSVWQNVVVKAEEYNEPGKFTAFIGYEWTPFDMAKGGRTLHHRVVVFKGGADATVQILPFSRSDSENPEDLWAYLAEYERTTKAEALAIPHNGNLSKGQMFALTDFNGRPLDTAYAKARSRWEPIVEVTQIKGDSETHPVVSPKDQFADYETWGNSSDNKKLSDSWRQFEYARSALKLGLGQQAKLGVNPFKFGMIGSTDAHTSLATADEDNFWGKMSIDEPHPARTDASDWIGWRMNAAGYAAIWAEENTRKSLFAAMKRKEIYATTGPRMTVRFFGGWDYECDDAFRHDIAKIGYTKGVPMGGDLTNAPKAKVPSFLIRAVKDPDGANLDRVQVIKGWHDRKGELHEKVYNVALSDGRKENWKGRVKAVGNTVNIKDASYTNSIGDPEFSVVWTDPDFDKNELAFYYVRVLEIPTPRWSAYDTKFFGLKDIPKEIPMVTQERAYTSPIWYTPSEH